MAAEYPPFMNAYGLISKILAKIKEAQTPDRFTQDFLATKLGFASGSAKAFIPLAKRIGLLESDGRPTEIYRSFRNPTQSKTAIATAIRKGFPKIFERNEYAHELDKKKLEGLIVEVTGLEQGHPTVRSIVGTFEGLKGAADFDRPEPVAKDDAISEKKPRSKGKTVRDDDDGDDTDDSLRLNLAYTINLVLPKTDDVAVFNAIFKSLKEHILKK